MKTLDLRSWDHSLVERLWRRWDRQPGVLGRFLSNATERCVGSILRRRLVARGQPPEQPLIVSVGNLRVGGTGKTPVVIDLAQRLTARGVTGVILTRGYGSACAGPLAVDPSDNRCGDEARLMASALDGLRWPVFQARKRSEGLAAALEVRSNLRVVLLEDGHQTAGVPRHLDTLILDRWHLSQSGGKPVARAECGLLMPWGPYRERAGGAERAAVWMVDVSSRDVKWPSDSVSGTGPGTRVLGFRRRLMWPDSALSAFTTNRSLLEPDSDQQWGILSGIARPGGFESGCRKLLTVPPVLAVRCNDHCRYRRRMVKRILAAGADAGVTAWLTTAKDHVKLKRIWPANLPLIPVGLDIEWAQEQTLDDIVVERLESL